MKKIIFCIICFLPFIAFSQEKKKVMEETTVKRVSVGVSIYQDFWFNWPKGMNVRAVNQGGSAFAMYGIPFGKSPVSFALGIGIGCHNLFSNTTIENIRADTISFTPISDTIDYKKSKLGLTYLDFPIELRLKTESKFNMAVGIKLGYLLDAKTKYKGENLDGDRITQKNKQVNGVDKFRFGPTIRVGYHWIQISAYYSITKIFDKGLGPDLYPLSVGFTFMPF